MTPSKHRTKKLLVFSHDVITNSKNILNTLHSIKERQQGFAYWVFTSGQLRDLNVKLNEIIGHDKWDIETRIHSIYGIKVKRGDNLQNRSSWQITKAYCDLDGQVKFIDQIKLPPRKRNVSTNQ